MTEVRSRSIWSWISLVFLGVLWGSSYIFIKKGLEVFSPVQVGTFRIALTGLAFLPMALYHLSKVKRKDLPNIAIVGFIGSFFPAFFFAFGQTHVSSAMAGVLSSLTPLFTLVIGYFFFRESGGWRKLVGVILGLIGAIWLILNQEGGLSGDWKYGLFIIAATIFYAFSSNIIHTKLNAVKPTALSSISFLMIGIPAAIILFNTDFFVVLQTEPKAWTSLYFLLFLSLFGTFLATMVYFNLVRNEGAVFSTMVGYFFPIVATLLGFWDGEVIGLSHYIGMALIVSGVYILRKID